MLGRQENSGLEAYTRLIICVQGPSAEAQKQEFHIGLMLFGFGFSLSRVGSGQEAPDSSVTVLDDYSRRCAALEPYILHPRNGQKSLNP